MLQVTEYAFKHEETVFLKSDPEQYARLVVAWVIYIDHVEFTLMCGTERTDHHEIEISRTKKVI